MKNVSSGRFLGTPLIYFCLQYIKFINGNNIAVINVADAKRRFCFLTNIKS